MPEFIRRTFRQPVTWVWCIALGLLGIFMIAFRPELNAAWLSFNLPADQVTSAMLSSRWVLVYNLFAFLVVFGISLFIIAPAMLPVQSLQEIWRAVFCLVMQMFGAVGPVVFVHEGHSDAPAEELRRTGFGVLVIDFNSAVVLEEEIPPPTLWSMFTFLIDDVILRLMGLMDPFQSPRVRGAGIVFTRRHERVRAIVDLRRQTRARPQIHAYTRDGIELSTVCWALFGLGLDPNVSNVLEVTYQGEKRAENLRAVTFREKGNRIYVQNFTNAINVNDRQEIHRFLQSSQNPADLRNPFTPIPFEFPLAPNFDSQRVFNAVITQARGPNEAAIPWQMMPLVVSIDNFRTLLFQWNYDELIRPGRTNRVDYLRDQVGQAVLNAGLRSFRYVSLANGQDVDINQAGYAPEELRASSVRALSVRPDTPLRARGISVIAAGFTELMPADAVLQQRLDNWRATWDSDTQIETASHNLEAARIRNQAYLRTQEDIITTLNRIFSDDSLSREALAINLVQLLESASSDPNTSKFLAEDVITLMRDIHTWLIPEDPSIYTPPR